MNWFDLVMVLMLACYLFTGYRQGLAMQLMGMFSFFLSLILALLGSRLLGERLATLLPLEGLQPAGDVLETGMGLPSNWIATLAASVFCFIGLFIIFQFIFRFAARELKFLNRLPVVGFANMLLGGGLGFLKGTLFIIILISSLSLAPVALIEEALDESLLARTVGYCLPMVTGALKDFLFSFFL